MRPNAVKWHSRYHGTRAPFIDYIAGAYEAVITGAIYPMEQQQETLDDAIAQAGNDVFE